MGGSGSGSGLGCIGLLGLLSGSQLQTDGAVPRAALLLLPAGEECPTGPDGARVSRFVCVFFFNHLKRQKLHVSTVYLIVVPLLF